MGNLENTGRGKFLYETAAPLTSIFFSKYKDCVSNVSDGKKRDLL